jgi:hypothetical protein
VKARRIVIGAGLGVYLVGLGMLAGVALDRMRFDRQRSEVLARYERSVTDLNAYRMALEKLAGGRP